MNTKLRSLSIVIGLTLLSGCVAYTPYPDYSGNYGYAAPVVPLPMYYGGWRHHGHHHHYH